MGLDVSFYEQATLVHEDKHPRALSEPANTPGEECWDHFTVLWIEDFPDQADGLPHHSCWETSQRDAHIHHSYGGYNIYREWLCMAAYGVLPEDVWSDPEKYKGQPFYEQINFADNEGTIGPKTAAKLAQDYRDQREKVMAFFAEPNRFFAADYKGWQAEMPGKYDEWAAAFALVGESGLVIFS